MPKIPDTSTDTFCAKLLALLNITEYRSFDMANLVAQFAMDCTREGGLWEQQRQGVKTLEFKTGFIPDRRKAPPESTDMICEYHPWLEWPHDDCLGPGCPPSTAMTLMKRRERSLQIGMQSRDTTIVELRRRVLELESRLAQARAALESVLAGGSLNSVRGALARLDE